MTSIPVHTGELEAKYIPIEPEEIFTVQTGRSETIPQGAISGTTETNPPKALVSGEFTTGSTTTPLGSQTELAKATGATEEKLRFERKEVPVTMQRQEKPPQIRETIHPVETTEVQPIIYREREQMEVHQVIQPIEEDVILPTEVIEKNLPAQYRGEFKESDELFKKEYEEGQEKGFTEVVPVERKKEVLPPIVQETIRKVIREEVQPIIYKQTIAPQLIKETVPIYEKVIETPIVKKEILPTRREGIQRREVVPQHEELLLKREELLPKREEILLKHEEVMPKREEVQVQYMKPQYEEGTIPAIPLGSGPWSVKIEVPSGQTAKVHLQAMPS